VALRRLGELDLDDRAVRDGDPLVDPADQLRSRREVCVLPHASRIAPRAPTTSSISPNGGPGCSSSASIAAVIRSCSARYELVDSRRAAWSVAFALRSRSSCIRRMSVDAGIGLPAPARMRDSVRASILIPLSWASIGRSSRWATTFSGDHSGQPWWT